MEDGKNRYSTSDTSTEALGAEPSHGRTSSLSASPGIAFDVADFLHFLSETDWSEAEKVEYASLVWDIVCEFVAMGFDLHPLQLAQESSGKLGAIATSAHRSCEDVLKSSHQSLIREFVSAGDVGCASAQEVSR